MKKLLTRCGLGAVLALSFLLTAIPAAQAANFDEIKRMTQIVNLEAKPQSFQSGEQIDFIVTLKFDFGSLDGFDIGIFHEGRLVAWEPNRRLNEGLNTFRIRDLYFVGDPGDYIVRVKFRGKEAKHMKYEDFTKKLENLRTPDIELPGHRQALRMLLLNSGRFRERAAMNWMKVLAPITAAVLVITFVGIFAVDRPALPYLGANDIGQFTSYDELRDFVGTKAEYKQFFWRVSRGDVFLEAAGAGDANAVPAPSDTGHSTTNIQVAGVDEADTVKTDGDYIYLTSGNKTIIMQAYPPEQARVVSEIEVEGTCLLKIAEI